MSNGFEQGDVEDVPELAQVGDMSATEVEHDGFPDDSTQQRSNETSEGQPELTKGAEDRIDLFLVAMGRGSYYRQE